MGSVHLARMRGIGGFARDVAIKFLLEDVSETPNAHRELIEEAKISARLKHPNVVPVLDVGEHRGAPFVVMEYVEGDSLAGLERVAARSARGALPKPISLRVICDALAGLHAAHELSDDEGRSQNLVHRDFSPQNILIGADGVARLTDFGVAKLAGRSITTTSGVVKGKLRYMSPEQVRGESLDRRSDVWAAGVMLWELFAGRRLFQGDSDATILYQILAADEPPRLLSILPSVPVEVDALIGAALARRVSDRTSTAAELRQAILSAARAHPELLAEHEEVAVFVRELIGPRLSERRSRIAVKPATRLVATPPSAVPEDRSDTTHANVATVMSSPNDLSTNVRTLGFAASGLLVLGLVGATLIGVSIGRGDRSAADRKSPQPLEPPSVPRAMPTAPEPAESAQLEPSATKTRRVELRSNQAIREVRYGDTTFEVSPPRATVAFVLPHNGDVQVEVTATDGRTTSGLLPSDQTKMDLMFASRVGKAQKDDDGLAPSPYRKSP